MELWSGIYEGHLRKGNFVMKLPNPFPNRKWQLNFATLVYNGICEYSIIQWYFATAFSNPISLLHYSDGTFDHNFGGISRWHFPFPFPGGNIPMALQDGILKTHFAGFFRTLFVMLFCTGTFTWLFPVKWGNAILKHRFIMAFANNALQQRRFPTVLFRYHFYRTFKRHFPKPFFIVISE